MNKERRRELGRLKMKQRVSNIFSSSEEYYSYENYICKNKRKRALYKYKDSGKPCSCSICKNEKYNRKVKHKKRWEN